MRGYTTALLFGLAAVLGTISAAEAQQQYGQDRYRPSPRPTFSPWLDLYRQDHGVLPNYHQFVRPKFEQQRRLREEERWRHEQDRLMRQQQAEMQRMEQRQQAGLQAAQEQSQRFQPRPTQFGYPTGKGSGFMRYGYFMTHRSYFGAGR